MGSSDRWSLFIVLSLFLFPCAATLAQSDASNKPSTKAPNVSSDGAPILLRDFRPVPKVVLPATPKSHAKFPVVDVHTHFFHRFRHDSEQLKGFLEVMDRNGIALCVSLDATLGVRDSEHLSYLWSAYKDRFVIFANLDFQGSGQVGDWSTWAVNQPDFGRRMSEALHQAQARGISGLKIFKQLGLEYRNPDGSFISIDDERFDPIWKTCGQLGLPIIMHTADPSAFFDPINASNERAEELERHPEWAFPSPPFPSRDSLHAARNRIIARHGQTIFIAAHLGNDGEDLAQVEEWLRLYPNLYVEFASRISELGRQPRRAKKFLEANADRILFGTDGPWPEERLRIYWRFLETEDEYFAYSEKSPPPQGLWNIDALGLSDSALERIYSKNAEKIIPGVADRLKKWHAQRGAQNTQTVSVRRMEDRAGIHNLLMIGGRILSGSQPESKASFEALHRLGVRTVISVDGLPPDIALANQAGLDYVHLPVGYDGIDPSIALKIAAVMNRSKGLVFIHCHHGKHRGPAAAAIAGLSCRLLDQESASQLMQIAGTSPKYSGLWKSVADFHLAENIDWSSITLAPTVAAPSMASWMAKLDRDWEELGGIKEAELESVSSLKDRWVPKLALVQESLAESARLIPKDSKNRLELMQAFEQSTDVALQLEKALLSGRSDIWKEAVKKMEVSCQQCHDKFRN